MTEALRADGVIKRFPGVVALKGVSFDLRAGEIHALCGENGAGKSTLIKILAGIHPHGSYEGALAVAGRPAAFRSVRDAEEAGIAVITQELALVEEMTVAENVFLGVEPRRGPLGLVDHDLMLHETRALLSRFGVGVAADAPVRSLGIGQRQLVEIVKAMRKRSRVLVLDEPTAALSEPEVAVLMDGLRDLRARGVACVYISHRLEEVLGLADRITVLRDGETVLTRAAADTDRDALIAAMVGRPLGDLYPRRAGSPGAPLLVVDGLDVAARARGPAALRGLSFAVRAGEVLGIGGLMGAGRTELLMHLFGAWGSRRAGHVTLDGALLDAHTTPAQAIRRGLVLVSEDRKRYGLIAGRSIGFNLSLSVLGSLTRGGLIDAGEERRREDRLFEALRIKAGGLDVAAGELSGGNQQKVVLGKALMAEPKVVMLDEPTRGIDVGAKVEIYQLVNALTAEGKAVVLVSSELPELIGMSDRILMLQGGRVGGTFARGEATQERLLAAAMPAGGPPPTDAAARTQPAATGAPS